MELLAISSLDLGTRGRERDISPIIISIIMSSPPAPPKSLTQATLAVSNKGNKLVYAANKNAAAAANAKNAAGAKQGWLHLAYI